MATYKKGVKRGVSSKIVEDISNSKDESSWMKEYRLRAYKVFTESKLPEWGPSKLLESFDFNKLRYYIPQVGKVARKWEDVPPEIRQKYDDLGIPEAERDFLAGLGAQYESEMIYHAVKEDLTKKGVIFETMEIAVKKYPDLVKKYFGKLIPPQNNKIAALNGAVWSGGSFIYIPPGVYVDMPLHNFFQMNLSSQGQFERTIIVAEEGSSVEFIEGCVAPLYSATSIHAGVVEVFVGKDACVSFTTIQNWSKNIWNLVTKKAVVEEGGSIEWTDGNVGSGITMKYPSVLLAGKGARCKVVSLVLAGSDQIIDSGAKITHVAPYTKSIVESRSILKKGGQASFRGSVFVLSGADKAESGVDCVSLLLTEGCRSDTYPKVQVENISAKVEHESSVLKISEEQLLYLMSRGMSENVAKSMVIGGFIEPFTVSLPVEYAVEFNRLVDLEITDGVG